MKWIELLRFRAAANMIRSAIECCRHDNASGRFDKVFPRPLNPKDKVSDFSRLDLSPNPLVKSKRTHGGPNEPSFDSQLDNINPSPVNQYHCTPIHASQDPRLDEVLHSSKPQLKFQQRIAKESDRNDSRS